MDALTFLESAPRAEPLRLYVVHGEEEFLRRRVLQVLKQQVLGKDGEEFAFSSHPGDKALFATVFDDLQTLPFFGTRRLVLVEGADPFVNRYRANIEKALDKLPRSGVLVLDL